MIPKTIHYCWFGGKPLPKSAIKCINSWKKFFPNYEIREWNESNFDVNMIPYTKEAYEAKKYAFVSDFARFWVLHEHGGVYFDTDVEVIRPMEDIIAAGAFMGMEKAMTPNPQRLYVNPGIGLACTVNHPLWNAIIGQYKSFEHFDIQTQGTVCTITSDHLLSQGATLDGNLTECQGCTIYPADYFCPQAMMGAPIELTENTRSIHHFDCTWLSWTVRLRVKIKNYFFSLFHIK